MKELLKILLTLTMTFGLLKAQGTEPVLLGPPQLLFDQGQGFLLEGPTFSPDGFLYFSDLTAFSMKPGDKTGVIWKYDLENEKASVFRSPSGQANGLMFDTEGRLVVCEGSLFGGRRITRTNLETGISELIVGLFDGKPLNSPNDVVIDEQGRIYFTDPKYAGHELMQQAVYGVYRVDTKLVTSLIIADIRKPNGVILSPDQKSLYVSTADDGKNAPLPSNYTGERIKNKGSLLAYDLTPEGDAKFREKLVDFGQSIGDGMSMDLEGNIYVAHPAERMVRVYSPRGEKLDEVKFPEDSGPITNMVFGRGKNSSTLFVTGGNKLYSLETAQQGYNLPFKNN